MESSVKTETADELLTLVKDQFEEYCDATRESRALAERCRAYRDGDQLSEAERKALKKRKQPEFIDNKIQDKCDTLLGIEKQMRTDPKAFPRTPGDEGASEAATDSLRYVADSSNYHRTTRKPAADNLMVEGVCYGQVVVEPRKGKMVKVCMEHIRFDRGYYDIRSLREDFEDKSYAGFFTWMDESEAKRQFDPKRNKNAEADALDHLSTSWSESSMIGPDRQQDDKPRYTMVKNGRKRVQVFEHYFVNPDDGKWWCGKWCLGGWLETPKVSAYKDEDGDPQCCIEVQALYRDSDGNPYGSVKRYLDLQDAHNKRHSKMLHLLNTKQLIAEKGAFPDIEKTRTELHKPDGVIEPVKGFQWEIQTHLDMAQGQFQLLQYTDAQLAATGPNAALSGTSGDLSGRAKELDQVSGGLPISPLFDALDSWELRMYRQAWCRVRQFWTSETWIRVTDDEDNLKFVGLNQPVLQGDTLAEQLKNQPIPPEEKQAALERIAQDPASQQPVIGPDGKPKMKNPLALMDVDIIIDRSMDTVNIQSEEFQKIVELAKSGAVQVPPDVLIEASQLRSSTKKRMLDKLSGKDDPMAQKMAELQQRLAEIEAAQREANVMKTLSEVKKNDAASAESQIDASVKVAEFADPSAQPAAKTQVSVN